jgi:hypothetical protein
MPSFFKGFAAAAAAVAVGHLAEAAAASDSPTSTPSPFPLQANPQAWVLNQSAFADASSLLALRWPEDDLDDVGGKPATAITFSGGGTRSYMASLGYLRALADLGLLQNVKYIAGVSGGSWATTAFVFFQRGVRAAGVLDFLGPIAAPSTLTMDALQNISASCGRASPVVKDLLEVCLGLALKFDNLRDIWTEAVYEVFLEPAGVLHDGLVTWDTRTRDASLLRNPALVRWRLWTRDCAWLAPRRASLSACTPPCCCWLLCKCAFLRLRVCTLSGWLLSG